LIDKQQNVCKGLVGAPRVGLGTSYLSGKRSTDELRTQTVKLLGRALTLASFLSGKRSTTELHTQMLRQARSGKRSTDELVTLRKSEFPQDHVFSLNDSGSNVAQNIIFLRTTFSFQKTQIWPE
jgi:hypothetical protein